MYRYIVSLVNYVWSFFTPRIDENKDEVTITNIISETSNNESIQRTCDEFKQPTTQIDRILNIRNGQENIATTTQNYRTVRFNSLYRLLRNGEDKKDGLSAKNSFSTTDIVSHVAYGSRGVMSKYISTCADLSSAINLRSISYFKGMIVKVHMELLPSSVEIIPLTTYEDRVKHIKSNHTSDMISRYNNFASRFQEVLLVGYVPSHCLSVEIEGL